MAEFLQTFAVEEMLKRVGQLAAEGISLAWGFKENLEKLKESLTMIQAVLQDAEARQVNKRSVRLWLQKLEDVACAAEDVMDEFAYESFWRKVEIRNQLKGKLALGMFRIEPGYARSSAPYAADGWHISGKIG